MTEPRILIGRIPPFNPHPYDVVADWIRAKHPDIAHRFHMCNLPYRLPKSAPYKLQVQWIQDPLDVTDPFSFLHALELQSDCDEQGIPVVNRVEKHKNTGKMEAYKRLSEAGIKTPRAFTFGSKEEFCESISSLRLPVIVREDVGHAGQFFLVRSADDAAAIPWQEIYRPVVTEYVDVRSSDGLFRKYRCVVVGDSVVTHHLQISDSWLTRGSNRIKNALSREEEIAYISQPDPFESSMRKVQKALDMEYLGIDYGIGPDGEVVVWEANQYPHLHFSKLDLIYRNFAMERTIAAMVHFYVVRAGLEPSEKLVGQAGY